MKNLQLGELFNRTRGATSIKVPGEADGRACMAALRGKDWGPVVPESVAAPGTRRRPEACNAQHYISLLPKSVYGVCKVTYSNFCALVFV